MSTPSPSQPRGTIRFEDLGEPVQRLIKSLKGDVTEEDYELLEFVSVKDMAKIYSEMATDRHAQEIWDELRASLQERKAKAARRDADLVAKQRELNEERAAEERRLKEQEEEEERERQAEAEERRRRQEERERHQQEEEEEAAAAARAQAEAAEAAAKEEERRQKAERKRKRREARARELQEEQEALEAERARQLAKRNRDQKKDWNEYVDSHPLDFQKTAADEDKDIAQEKLRHTLNAPPKVSDAILFRTYTPKCPCCGTRYTQPPPEWVCPSCSRRYNKAVLVWQPDDDTKVCMCCKGSIGRWTRHHCRNCGRLVCSNCSGNRAIITALGYVTPVKVCDQCASNKPAAKGW